MAEQAGIAIEHISFSFRIASAFAEIGLLTGRAPLVVQHTCATGEETTFLAEVRHGTGGN